MPDWSDTLKLQMILSLSIDETTCESNPDYKKFLSLFPRNTTEVGKTLKPTRKILYSNESDPTMSMQRAFNWTRASRNEQKTMFKGEEWYKKSKN